jgi:hypothetical protein
MTNISSFIGNNKRKNMENRGENKVTAKPELIHRPHPDEVARARSKRKENHKRKGEAKI